MQTLPKALYIYDVGRVFSVEFVSKIKSILLIVCLAIYGDACIQLTRFSCDDREDTCILSDNRHHQIVSVNH